MDKLAAKLKEEFYLYGATIDDYQKILMDFDGATSEEEKLNFARAQIRAEILTNWQNKKRDWLVNFIEESFCLGNTRSYNIRYAIYLLENLKSLSIILDEESLQFLTNKSPKFKSLLESIIQHRRKELGRIILFHPHELLNDTLKKYVIIRKNKPFFTEMPTKITLQEERETQQKARACLAAKDWDGYTKYRNILIENLQETIETTAKNYLGYGYSFEELVSLGNLHLLENLENQLQSQISLLRTRITCALIHYFSALVRTGQNDSLVVEQSKTQEDPMFDGLYQKEAIEVTRQVVRDLKPQVKRTIGLRYGLSNEVIISSPHSPREIARIEGLSHQAIESRIKIALKTMRNHPAFLDFFEEKEYEEDYRGLETILNCNKQELFILLAGIPRKEKEVLQKVFKNDLSGNEDVTNLSDKATSRYASVMKQLEEDLNAIRSYQNSDLFTIIGEKSYHASKIGLFLKLHPEIESIIVKVHGKNLKNKADYNSLSLEEKRNYHQGIVKIKTYLATIKAQPYLWKIIEYEGNVYDIYYTMNRNSPISSYLAIIFGPHYTAREEVAFIDSEEKYIGILLELKKCIEQVLYQRINRIEFTSDGILFKHDDIILPHQIDISKDLLSALDCTQVSIMMFSAYVGLYEKRKTLEELEKMFQLTQREEIKRNLKTTFELLCEIAQIRNISLGGDLIESLGHQRKREKPKD